jgi:hypothetical protein
VLVQLQLLFIHFANEKLKSSSYGSYDIICNTVNTLKHISNALVSNSQPSVVCNGKCQNGFLTKSDFVAEYFKYN